MNRQFIIGLFIFGLITLLIGVSIGMLGENIKLNSEITDKIKTISESEKPIFKIGEDLYYISKFDKSSNNLTSFDRCYDDTTIRTP